MCVDCVQPVARQQAKQPVTHTVLGGLDAVSPYQDINSFLHMVEDATIECKRPSLLVQNVN